MAWSGSPQLTMIALACAEKSYKANHDSAQLPEQIISRLTETIVNQWDFLNVAGLTKPAADFIKHACVATKFVRDAGFPSSGNEVATDFLLGVLGVNSFHIKDLRKAETIVVQLREAVADLTFPGDLEYLQTLIHDNFVHLRPVVSSDTFTDLFYLAEKMSVVAEDVPLGSLAAAISDLRKCTITLRAHEALRSNENRAVYWHRETQYGREYWIQYAPADDGRSVYDAKTRYEVAHELAHVLLGHEPSNGNPSIQDEQEAHIMAIAFLRHQGIPERRSDLSFRDVVEIVSDSKSLPAASRIGMLREVEHHFIGHPQRPLAAAEAIRDYFANSLIRRWAELELSLGIQAVLGQ